MIKCFSYPTWGRSGRNWEVDGAASEIVYSPEDWDDQYDPETGSRLLPYGFYLIRDRHNDEGAMRVTKDRHESFWLPKAWTIAR